LKKSVEVFHMCQQQGHVFLYRHELEHRRTRKKNTIIHSNDRADRG
jgi:hypothetical protein